MADYGFKVSEKGVNAITATGTDIIMSTRYPFAKIDPTKSDSFRTTTVTFITDTPDNVKTLIAQFAHGYSYKPQLWGLWNVVWGPSIAGSANVEQNGYGVLVNSAGIPNSSLSYEWDATNVYLYLNKGANPPGTPSNAIGTVATLTTYIFVDDLQDASY